MAMEVSWWERRDQSDREALANAALAHCKALQDEPGRRSARFCWSGPDTVVLVEDVESLDVPSQEIVEAEARTFFVLADLARQARQERWQDPGQGEVFYRLAGR